MVSVSVSKYRRSQKYRYRVSIYRYYRSILSICIAVPACFDGAHLTGKLFDDTFYEKTKEVKEKLAHTVADCYEAEDKNDLNMRITMDELKQAIKKMNTNNKGVDPYGLHPKLLKKIKFSTFSICLHLINSAFFMGNWPFDKTIVKF